MSRSVPGWVTLTEGETVVWTGGPSNVRIAEELLGEFVLVAIGIGLVVVPPDEFLAVPDLGVAPLALAAVGIALAVATYLRFRAIEYLVTTEELYVKRGLVSRDVRNLRLGRVQDSGFRQSVLQRALGYGDVYVSTAGGSGIELAFEHVPDPSGVNGIITELLADVRGDDVSG